MEQLNPLNDPARSGETAYIDNIIPAIDLVMYLKQMRIEQNIGWDDDAVERVAAQAHEAWSGWMKYMLPRLGLVRMTNGEWILMPAGEKADRVTYDQFDGCLSRWMRQMQTPYAELPEDEKESDRTEARRYLAALAALDGSEGAG